ncbi:MAG: methyltransferase domain-containing protein [Flavobacteriaceae bacterium]|nr:methyltransferase domain-containing protein [Flavobacteriaceae bacterium]
MTKDNLNWYSSWFNTPFYHILYKDRDASEAKRFMENLTAYLNIPKAATILDLACGKGRHSVHLNSLGFDVTGLDLSEASIAHAKQFQNETLHFAVHNMSLPYHKKFDAVFNLFTSFGYFEDETDNLNTIKAIKANLTQNGIGVIDFMNVNYTLNNLVPEDVKHIEGINFKQKRYENEGYIIKDISFEHNNQHYKFQERVKALSLDDFKVLFERAGIQLLETFGDYKLKKYHPEFSERLIMIFM